MYRFGELINSYGYIIIFISLFLELIALPLPGEIFMAYCGFLIYDGKLNCTISILSAVSGAVCGITLAYYIGLRFEKKVLEKYGKYIHLSRDRLDRVSEWFDKFGNKFLTIAYFIPGVRHITGYVSGLAKLSYRKFAVNAYIGALIWVTFFTLLGRYLGSRWIIIDRNISKYLMLGAVVIIIAASLVYIYKLYYRKNSKNK